VIVQQDSATPVDRVSYVKFDLSALPADIQRAELRLFARVEGDTSTDVTFFEVSDDNWDDAAAVPTWNNRPALGSSLGATSFFRDLYAWGGVDVTSFVQSQVQGNGTVSFAWQASEDGSPALHASTREHGPADGVPRETVLRVYLP